MNKYEKIGKYVLTHKHRLPKEEFKENILRIARAMGMLRSKKEIDVLVAELEISFYARDIILYLKEDTHEAV